MRIQRRKPQENGGADSTSTTTTQSDTTTTANSHSTTTTNPLPADGQITSTTKASSTSKASVTATAAIGLEDTSAGKTSTTATSTVDPTEASASTAITTKTSATSTIQEPPPTTTLPTSTCTASGGITLAACPVVPGLSSGAKAGIAVAVIVLFFICGALGYLLFRRKKGQPFRWNYGLHGRKYRDEHWNAQAAPLRPPPPPGELNAVVDLWTDPPKDDDTMLRHFRGIEGRFTDHILNFYIPDGGVVQTDKLSQLSSEDREKVESYVSQLKYLVSAEISRVAVLRAILGGIVWGAFDQGAFFTDRKGGTLISSDPGLGKEGYQAARERIILRLAEAATRDLQCFEIEGRSEEARLRGMESIVRAVAEFATVVEQQPVEFALLWNEDGSAFEKRRTQFVPEWMEISLEIPPRQGHEPRVRCVVYPGLSKLIGGKRVLLWKIQVLLY